MPSDAAVAIGDMKIRTDAAGALLDRDGPFVDEAWAAVRKDRAKDAAIAKFVHIDQTSPKVRAAISQAFAGNPKLCTLPWDGAGPS